MVQDRSSIIIRAFNNFALANEETNNKSLVTYPSIFSE